MKKHVLILGAGFGGLELATRLSETVPDRVSVTLLDRNDSFFFGFSKLDVMMGEQSPDDARMYYRDIAKQGVEFRQETVTAIDPSARRVEGWRQIAGSRPVRRRCAATVSPAGRGLAADRRIAARPTAMCRHLR